MASKEEYEWGVGLPPTGRGDVGGVHTGGGDLLRPPPEYGLTIHWDQAHYGPLSGSGARPRDKGVKVVVGEGVPEPVGMRKIFRAEELKER